MNVSLRITSERNPRLMLMLMYRTVIVDMDWMNHLRCPAGWHTSGRPLQRVV